MCSTPAPYFYPYLLGPYVCDDGIYRYVQIAKIYCSGKPASNMKRLAEELERSTGGVIISRSGGSILLLRPEEITSVWRMSNEED